MRSYGFLPILFLLLASTATAQHEWDVWCFGSRAALTFSGGSAVAASSGISSVEGCATIADRQTGELLFYSNGETIWNRNHDTMPRGGRIPGNASSTQSVVIVPDPGSPYRYYVITTDASIYDRTANEGMHYVVVDMREDTGRGDVVSLPVKVQATAAEKVVAIRDCATGAYWVITHELNNRNFHSYRIDETGFHDGAVSPVGLHYNGKDADSCDIGEMAVSSAGLRIATARSNVNAVEVFDFDRTTGRLSNALQVGLPESARNPYGVCFSPDGTKLYVSLYGMRSGRQEMRVVQFDIVSYDSATVAASGVTVGAPSAKGLREYSIGALRLGPDGRIYCSTTMPWLDVIESPNDTGSACGYGYRGVLLPPGSRSSLGLPNIISTSGYRAPEVDFEMPQMRVSIGGDQSVALNTGAVIPVRTRDVIGFGTVIFDASFGRFIALDTVRVAPELEGSWRIEHLLHGSGYYRGRLVALQPDAVIDSTMAQLFFRTYIGDTLDVHVQVRLLSEFDGCSRLVPDTMQVHLGPVCGLNLRLIERPGARYSLSNRGANPVSGHAMIGYSVGLDGPAQLLLFDAFGRVASVLVDGYLPAGEYQAVFDAGRLESGVYTVRLVQGSAHREIRVVVQR